jgi:hypothetical protein
MFSGSLLYAVGSAIGRIWAHSAAFGQQIGLAAQTEMLEIKCRVSRIAIASGATRDTPASRLYEEGPAVK